MFAERLRYIMEITYTRASELGRAANLNSSHVSRLRSGNRPLPKKPDFLPAMSFYLARRVCADYQREGLCQELNLTAWPLDEREAATLIERWLLGAPEAAADMEPFLSSFTGTVKQAAASMDLTERELPPPSRFYYGAPGKQAAVLQFFDRIKKEKSPQTLLLSSDEDLAWLYEDAVFARHWEEDFNQVLRAGNRVQIIHHVGRDLNELLEAVAKWVPVYMTGMIEPYYYPRLRDGISRRTLFLAPRSAAVVSASIMRNTEGMLNEFITEPEALAALVKEYENFFALCRPLMKIILQPDAKELWDNLHMFMEDEGDLICMGASPTLATMPPEVAKAMQNRAPQSRILELWEIYHSALRRNLEKYSYTELLSTSAEDTHSSLLPSADFLGAPGLCYRPEELQAHWENMRQLAQEKKNYRYVINKGITSNLLLYSKESLGSLLIKADEPNLAFIISESNMANAIWDYLESKMETH